MASSHEDIERERERKKAFHYTTLSWTQTEPVRWHLCRLQNVFTVCDENAAEWPCVLKVLKQTFLFTGTVRLFSTDTNHTRCTTAWKAGSWTQHKVNKQRSHIGPSSPKPLTGFRIKIMCARANTQTLAVGWYGVVLVRIGSLYLVASVPYKFFNNGVTCETSLTCTRTFPIVKEYKTCNTRFQKQTAFVFRWTNSQSVTMEKVLMHISDINSLCSNYIKRVTVNKSENNFAHGKYVKKFKDKKKTCASILILVLAAQLWGTATYVTFTTYYKSNAC